MTKNMNNAHNNIKNLILRQLDEEERMSEIESGGKVITINVTYCGDIQLYPIIDADETDTGAILFGRAVTFACHFDNKGSGANQYLVNKQGEWSVIHEFNN